MENDTKELQTMLQWRFKQEKKPYIKDREHLMILIGVGSAFIAIITKTYIFAALILFATYIFVREYRKPQAELLFDITDEGIFISDEFMPVSSINSFNIVDVPGETAKLILNINNGYININEIVPIYDINIDEIEDALIEIGINYDPSLELNILDTINSIV